MTMGLPGVGSSSRPREGAYRSSNSSLRRIVDVGLVLVVLVGVGRLASPPSDRPTAGARRIKTPTTSTANTRRSQVVVPGLEIRAKRQARHPQELGRILLAMPRSDRLRPAVEILSPAHHVLEFRHKILKARRRHPPPRPLQQLSEPRA